jgi:L-rhamnose mutarotase
MKRTVILMVLTVIVFSAFGLYGGDQPPHVQRVGMVIGIKPDRISTYEALHAASNPGVRDLLNKYHMHNFSIYIQKLDNGQYVLFGYYEYTGSDYKTDMARLAVEPRNKKWLSMTDPLQIPLSGQTSWTKMQEIYHNP